MIAEKVKEEYFEYLCNIATANRYDKDITYRKLLRYLHNTDFTYLLVMDENRAHDGIGMRKRFALANGFDSDYFEEELKGPCSVLEMMLALAIRTEENIMDNTLYGDRSMQWFWQMTVSLGVSEFYDTRYDEEEVSKRVSRFLNREYAANGKGGLFTIKNTKRDLREVEIWAQLNWYLNSIGG